MKFSVIIPSYNRGPLIVNTINSVLNQTYKNFEIIIVDNCSTDNTIEVLQPILQKHENIHLIRNEQNFERSISRNIGFKAAKGDFLTLLDSDDFMYPNNLLDASNFIKPNPEIKIFHNLYELIDSDKKLIRKYSYPSLKNYKLKILKGNFFSCIGVFLSKEIYQNYFFDENKIIVGSEDWELWIRILADFKPGRINRVNNGILHHDSRSIDKFTIDSAIERVEYIGEKIKKDKNLQENYGNFINQFYASGYLFAASSANSAKMFKLAFKLSVKAFKFDWKCIFEGKFIRILQISIFRIKNK